jgi:ribosome-associated protein
VDENEVIGDRASGADRVGPDRDGADGASSSSARPRLSPREAADLAFETALEKKGRDVLLLDVGACSDLADYMIVATASNSRQTAAVALEVDRKLRAHGVRRLNLSGIEPGIWAVLDFGDVFIHVMQPRERRYYDLEALWADAEVVRREAGGGDVEAEVPSLDEEA